MLWHLAKQAEVPVVIHLDHGRSNDARCLAIESGFTSVKFDGSDLLLREHIDRTTLIAAGIPVPLVMHGGSGVTGDERRLLARDTPVCKINIGTELRMAFGAALRDSVLRDADRFDRVAILSDTEAPVRDAARAVIRTLSKPRELS